MIVKTSKGYKVVSSEGKNMSASNLTLAEAKKRMKDVEMFKHMKQQMSIGEVIKRRKK